MVMDARDDEVYRRQKRHPGFLQLGIEKSVIACCSLLDCSVWSRMNRIFHQSFSLTVSVERVVFDKQKELKVSRKTKCQLAFHHRAANA